MSELPKLDFQTLNFLYQWTSKSSYFLYPISALAVYGVYTVPIFLVIFYFFQNKRWGLLALLAGIFSWLVLANLISFLFLRSRPPLEPLGFPDPLFHRPLTTFPSEHASLLFTLGFLFLWAKYRGWAYFFLTVAILTSLARMAVGIHFPSDILAALLVGLISAWLFYIGKEIFFNFLIDPLLKILSKVKL